MSRPQLTRRRELVNARAPRILETARVHAEAAVMQAHREDYYALPAPTLETRLAYVPCCSGLETKLWPGQLMSLYVALYVVGSVD